MNTDIQEILNGLVNKNDVLKMLDDIKQLYIISTSEIDIDFIMSIDTYKNKIINGEMKWN